MERNEGLRSRALVKLFTSERDTALRLHQVYSISLKLFWSESVQKGTMSLPLRVVDPSMLPAQSTEPEIEWMAQVREGDTEAFRLLVEAHQARVIGTISKMLGSDAEAEDLAQQVFIRIWKSAPRYQPSAKFTTWLFRITRNLVFNELRRKRHFIDQIEDIAEPAERTDKEPDQVLLEEELQRAIQEAIHKLPESQRMAIILRRYEEMPYEEIANIMGTTVPAVKSILFRARTELRERLAKYLT